MVAFAPHGPGEHLVLGRVHRVRAGDARARPRRLSSTAARGRDERSGHLDRDLGRARADLCGRTVLRRQSPRRAHVSHRLRDRRGAERRQHLRDGADLRVLPSSEELAAPRLVLRHPRRAGDARRVHRGRVRADHEVPLDSVHLRRLARGDGRPHGDAPRRRVRRREEPDRAHGASSAAAHASVPRCELHGDRKRGAAWRRRSSSC